MLDYCHGRQQQRLSDCCCQKLDWNTSDEGSTEEVYTAAAVTVHYNSPTISRYVVYWTRSTSVILYLHYATCDKRRTCAMCYDAACTRERKEGTSSLEGPNAINSPPARPLLVPRRTFGVLMYTRHGFVSDCSRSSVLHTTYSSSSIRLGSRLWALFATSNVLFEYILQTATQTC